MVGHIRFVVSCVRVSAPIKEMDMANEKVCLVIGAGDATGGAIARKFAAEGYTACVVRRARHIDELEQLAQSIRDAGGKAHAFGVDARQEDEMVALFDKIENEIGEIDVAVFNIGANVMFPIVETTARVFTKVWEMACFAGFLTGREAAKRMEPRGRGTILFTGATASVRGREGFAAFASAKHALKAVAQSMARELGPKGVHVAHMIVDGPILTDWTRERFPGLDEMAAQDGVVLPASIADIYWSVHQQPKNAWTFELDVRPHSETW